MKRILTIVVALCLAITMTCFVFAVDDSIVDSSAEVTDPYEPEEDFDDISTPQYDEPIFDDEPNTN